MRVLGSVNLQIDCHLAATGGNSRAQSVMVTQMTSICSYPWICVIRVPQDRATAFSVWRQV